MTPSEDAPFPITPVPPEILEWARQTHDTEAMIAEIEDAKVNGVPFETVLASVVAAMRDES